MNTLKHVALYAFIFMGMTKASGDVNKDTQLKKPLSSVHSSDADIQMIESVLQDYLSKKENLLNLGQNMQKAMVEKMENERKIEEEKQLIKLGKPTFIDTKSYPLFPTEAEQKEPSMIIAMMPECGHCMTLLMTLGKLASTIDRAKTKRTAHIWIKSDAKNPESILLAKSVLFFIAKNSLDRFEQFGKLIKDELTLPYVSDIISQCGFDRQEIQNFFNDIQIDALLAEYREKIKHLSVAGFPSIYVKNSDEKWAFLNDRSIDTLKGVFEGDDAPLDGPTSLEDEKEIDPSTE